MKSKLLPAVVIGLVVLFVARNPTGAAVTASNLGAALGHLADGIGVFVTNLSGGGR
jgi:hypothetical protein